MVILTSIGILLDWLFIFVLYAEYSIQGPSMLVSNAAIDSKALSYIETQDQIIR